MTALVRSHAPVFIFSAQGTQWAGMGHDLMLSSEAFREAIYECDTSIRRHFGWSLVSGMLVRTEDYRLHSEPRMVQPALTSIQIAIARVLVRDGVLPAAVGALSMGEAAAAYCSGAIDLDSAIDLACSTARLADTRLRPGLMAFVRISWTECADFISGFADRVAPAIELGPVLTVISGEEAAVKQILSNAIASGVECGTLPLPQAYHSPDVATLRPGFLQGISAVRSRAPSIDCYSSVTARVVTNWSPDHWWSICRDPARFYSLAMSMIRDGYREFIEIGPHPMLAQSIEEAGEALGARCRVRASMRRGQGVCVAA